MRAKQILLTAVSVVAFFNYAAAQPSPIDTKLALRYFRELKQTSDRDGGKTWGVPLYGE